MCMKIFPGSYQYLDVIYERLFRHLSWIYPRAYVDNVAIDGAQDVLEV